MVISEGYCELIQKIGAYSLLGCQSDISDCKEQRVRTYLLNEFTITFGDDHLHCCMVQFNVTRYRGVKWAATPKT